MACFVTELPLLMSQDADNQLLCLAIMKHGIMRALHNSEIIDKFVSDSHNKQAHLPAMK